MAILVHSPWVSQPWPSCSPAQGQSPKRQDRHIGQWLTGGAEELTAAGAEAVDDWGMAATGALAFGGIKKKFLVFYLQFLG